MNLAKSWVGEKLLEIHGVLLWNFDHYGIIAKKIFYMQRVVLVIETSLPFTTLYDH